MEESAPPAVPPTMAYAYKAFICTAIRLTAGSRPRSSTRCSSSLGRGTGSARFGSFGIKPD